MSDRTQHGLTATDEVRRMMLEGIADILLTEAALECCGDIKWRKRLCPVHQGWEDGMGALIDKMLDTAQVSRMWSRKSLDGSDV